MIFPVVLVLLSLAFLYYRRSIQKSILVRAGRRGLSQQPDTIELARVPGEGWSDPVTAEWLAEPLREKGFTDLGVYRVFPLAGFKLGVMVNEEYNVAAFICERPGSLGLSLELNVRYVDGTTTMLINRADNGVPKPPFFRVIFDASGASSGALYERLLRERSSAGIKAVTARSVIPEYQSAWTRMMRWEKGRGLTAEEVAGIAKGGPSISGSPAAGRDSSSNAWSADFPGQATAATAMARKRRIAQVILAVPAVFFMRMAVHGISDEYQRNVVEPRRRLTARAAWAKGAVSDIRGHDHPDNAPVPGDRGWSLPDMVLERGWSAFLGLIFLVPIFMLERENRSAAEKAGP